MKELFEAVRAGDLSRVKALVEANPSLAIFAASIQGDADVIQALLAADEAQISKTSEDGWTPLHLAAFYGRHEAARLLLDKGAAVDARSTNAMQNMPLHAAAAGKHAEMARLLLEHGASVDARQNGGWTAMHAAAQNGDLPLAKILMEAGADLSARAENNQRPLDLALTKGQQQMVEFLETHGAAL